MMFTVFVVVSMLNVILGVVDLEICLILLGIARVASVTLGTTHKTAGLQARPSVSRMSVIPDYAVSSVRPSVHQYFSTNAGCERGGLGSQNCFTKFHIFVQRTGTMM